MIDRREIETEIKRLEEGEINFSTCAKLADLYAIRDHLAAENRPKMAGYSFGSSEFAMACEKAPLEAVLGVLDEHMEAISILYPKEYSAIIKKIKKAAE